MFFVDCVGYRGSASCMSKAYLVKQVEAFAGVRCPTLNWAPDSARILSRCSQSSVTSAPASNKEVAFFN